VSQKRRALVRSHLAYGSVRRPSAQFGSPRISLLFQPGAATRSLTVLIKRSLSGIEFPDYLRKLALESLLPFNLALTKSRSSRA